MQIKWNKIEYIKLCKNPKISIWKTIKSNVNQETIKVYKVHFS